MSKEYPCIHWDGGKCKAFSDERVTSWCVESPCDAQRMSNADRIRAMSDEELATFHVGMLILALNEFGINVTDDIAEAVRKNALKHIKQPAEEDAE